MRCHRENLFQVRGAAQKEPLALVCKGFCSDTGQEWMQTAEKQGMLRGGVRGSHQHCGSNPDREKRGKGPMGQWGIVD